MAAYVNEGLLQRPLSPKTVYRYKGVLLAYEKALQGAIPTVQSSVQFLLRMRQDKFSESAIGVHRAALVDMLRSVLVLSVVRANIIIKNTHSNKDELEYTLVFIIRRVSGYLQFLAT